MKKTICIIASGASLTVEDVIYCRDRIPVLAVNNNYQLAPFARYLYACDGQWIARHADALREFKGKKYTIDTHKRPGWIRLEGVEGYEIGDRDRISWGGTFATGGGNSGFQAMCLAASRLRYRRILLLGFDMKGAHWHPDHPEGLGNPLPHNFPRWIEGFERGARYLDALGVEVIDCTRDGALHCFEKLPIWDVPL